MGDLSDDLSALLDHRLAAHATAAVPVWLWSTDATRLLWANPVGAAALGARSFATLAGTHFVRADPAIAQVARLAATLYPSGATILHRLRGFGAPLGRARLCACTRVTVDGRGAVLVVAQEAPGQAAGPRLSLDERARRLCESYSVPVAAFAPDGRLVAANPAAEELTRQAGTIAALAAEPLAAAALAGGGAAGETPRGPVALVRVGEGADTLLLVRLPAEGAAESVPPAESAVTEPFAADAVAPAPGPAAEQAAAEEAVVAPAADETPVAPAEPEVPDVVAEAGPEPAAPAESQPAEPEPAEPESAEPELAEPAEADEAAWRADADHDTAAGDDLGDDPGGPAAAGEPAAPSRREPPPLLRIDAPTAERRYPLRFVWQMDAEGRFTLGSDEFTEVIGPRVALALGRPWREIAAVLGLDPEGRVLRAVDTRDTWSGLVVSFPVDGSEERLDVELSGLPVYDRNRVYLGYRGFGVCRDLDRLTEFGRIRHAPIFTIAEPPTPARRSTDRPAGAAADPESPENVVRFPGAPESRPAAPNPVLSAGEHNAFREIARQLQARLAGDIEEPGDHADAPPPGEPGDASAAAPDGSAPAAGPLGSTALLDRLPAGILVYRFHQLLYANRSFLETTGYPDLGALAAAGGLDSLFVAGDADLATAPDSHGQSLAILTRRGDRKPVAARLFSVPWNGESAFALVLAPAGGERTRAGEVALRRAEATIRDLHALLDTAFDGVVVLTRDGRIVSASHSAEVLFGAEAGGLADTPFADLFAPDSRAVVADGLARMRRSGRVSLDAGREVTGLVRRGGAIPLVMTMGPMVDGSDRLCAVFRDRTQARGAGSAATAGPGAGAVAPPAGDATGLLAKLGHGLRTPLTAVMGFADLMLEERYGPVGNERYREYLRDVRAAAQQMAALLDDSLSLSQAESGTLELTFAPVDLNEIVQAAVKTMQPQANRERIIIRSSLALRMPPIVADTRSLHQIILNLIGNAIRLGGPGGQVIVSTGQNARGQVVLRVRDTGHGMSRKDLETALQPFARADTAPPAGNGLGLPLTKALAEANRGTFAITSRVNDGTLVEVTFPRPKIPAE